MRTLSLVVLLGLSGSALAQEASSSRSEDIEELVVPGRAPESLRVEIERLETAVYDRFNALNSDDEFDIHCLEHARTGSNIPSRTCAPNFVIRAESRAAMNTLRDGRSGLANHHNPAEQRMRMEQKSRELTAEIQRVAREDEQLLRDLVRLDEIKLLQSSGDR